MGPTALLYPLTQSEEEIEEDGPAGTQDDHVVEESDSKSAAVETSDSTKLLFQENEAIQQNALANGCEEENTEVTTILLESSSREKASSEGQEHNHTAPNARVQRSSKLEGGSTGKVFIAEQIANTKVLRASMKTAKEQLAEKDVRIAELEKIVEGQQKASAKKESARMKLVCAESAQKSDRIAQLEKLVEDQRKDIEDKEGENNMLRDNLSSREKDLEEQRQTLTTKEEDLKNVIWQRNEIHRTWAILEARMKKLDEAFSWQPDMEDKKGKAE